MPDELQPAASVAPSTRVGGAPPAALRVWRLSLTSAGHALFAATLIGIGLTGLATGGYVSIWHSVPTGLPGRGALAYLCACVSLACGAGLLVERFAATAARTLALYLLAWLLLIKGYYVAASPSVEVNYQSAGETAVLAAGAWVLYASLAGGWDQRHLRFAVGSAGVRLARMLYGLALIAFGLSHFAYLQLTAPLVPAWLPAHTFWAYFTGCAYLAAAVAILTGTLARPAAVLATVQMGLFTLLVWVPLVASSRAAAGQWTEFGVSWALTAAAWVLADSFRGTAWLAGGRRAPPPDSGLPE